MTKKKIKLKKKNITLVILICLFVISITKLVWFYIDLQKSKDLKQELIDEVITQTPEIIEDEEQEEIKEVFTVDFEKLLSINNRTIGWIRFNHDKISYPIVQADDNSYYLNHSFDKSNNQLGAIFMDYRNNSLQDKNVVIYGHNAYNDSMFTSIQDVFNDSFFNTEENNYIQIINPNNEVLTYQIFSYYIIEKEEYYITTSFSSNNAFYSFIDAITRRSYKKFDVEVTTSDNILTLSTCYGFNGTSKRKVVHAKRILLENS